MANGFRHGPACCCCKFIYNDATLRYINFQALVGDEYPNERPYLMTAGKWSFDEKNKLVFAAGVHTYNAVAYRGIYRINDKLLPEAGGTVPLEVLDLSATSRSIIGIACDPEAQKLYYGEIDNIANWTDVEIHQCDYDGANDSIIYTVDHDAGNQAFNMRFCRNNDKLYFAVRTTTDAQLALWRIDNDGTNDTLIYTPPATNVTLEQHGFDFDNVTGRLYLTETKTAATAQTWIRYMDLDGSGNTVYHTPGPDDGSTIPTRIQSARFSHSKQRLLWWQQRNGISTGGAGDPNDPLGGYWSGDHAGGDKRHEYGRHESNEGTGTGITWHELGCGFETWGSGNLG